jgi:hypothetical protein
MKAKTTIMAAAAAAALALALPAAALAQPGYGYGSDYGYGSGSGYSGPVYGRHYSREELRRLEREREWRRDQYRRMMWEREHRGFDGGRWSANRARASRLGPPLSGSLFQPRRDGDVHG